jgi:hypothetical protein
MGVRQSLFPMPTLGAIQAADFPTLFSMAKRSFRPRSRAVQRVADAGVLSEAFQLASTDGCATGLRTRPRHVCDSAPRLDHLARGQPPGLAVRSPRATGLAS